MVRALPDDGNRYEVVDGILLVSPSPSWPHQRAVAELWAKLNAYLRSNRAGAAYLAPADVEFNPRRMVEPDAFVVPLVDGRVPMHFDAVRSLLLAIEVLSPSTARSDRHIKRRLYQSEGVGEYWIVDLEARSVERWRPADERPEILDVRIAWQPTGAPTSLEIDLVRYFADVFDEAPGAG